MSRIALVLAMAENGVIGNAGALPWRIPEDMRRFRQLTLGKPCIMGRRTWESLPKKPLQGRVNIVVTRDRAFRAEGAEIAHTLEQAIGVAETGAPPEIMIIGGADIYRAALPRADTIYLTEIHRAFHGDVRLTPFPVAVWRETSRENHETNDDHSYSFVRLERRGSAG